MNERTNRRLKSQIVLQFGTQDEFAYKLGVSSSYVSLIVRGFRPLSDSAKEQWAELLGCEVSDVFGDPAPCECSQ